MERLRLAAALTLFVALVACGGGTGKPDVVSRTIVENFVGCMPGLKVADVKRVSDRRYYISTDRYVAVWRVSVDDEGLVSTAPWDAEEAAKFASWGCYD